MAMLPFCGYNMGQYFKHWLKVPNWVGKTPEIFLVNWFRKNEKGGFMWPGYGDNMRVLKWMFERINNSAQAQTTPLGYSPNYGDLEWNGLQFSQDQFNAAMSIDAKKWMTETEQHKDFFQSFASTLPTDFINIQEKLYAQFCHLNNTKNLTISRNDTAYYIK